MHLGLRGAPSKLAEDGRGEGHVRRGAEVAAKVYQGTNSGLGQIALNRGEILREPDFPIP